MEFAFTPDQTLVAGLAGQFLADQATGERTRAAMASGGIDAALWRGFCTEAGLAGIAIPEEYGGAGLGPVELALVAEAAGRQLAAIPLVATLGLFVPALLAGGSVAQRRSWLPALRGGKAVAAVAELEAAELRGGRISGVAPRVAHGAEADVLLVVSADTAWLVAPGNGGVVSEPQTSMDQTRPLARLRLADAPAEPLAEPPAGLAAMRLWGWTMIAADALGGAQACLDRTVAYAREREQFGRPIGAFQAVKHRLADLSVEIEQARSAVYWAAGDLAAGGETEMSAHAAKAVATTAYAAAAAAMIQLHGGIGFTWEHDAHLFFKRARADRSWLGTPEWHLDRIADLMPLGTAA